MAPRFQGKVCVITGAASGIGYATAIKMASDGAILALCDNNEIGLADVGRACETGHITHVVDVSYSTACNDFIDDIIRKCGTIDLVGTIALDRPFETGLIVEAVVDPTSRFSIALVSILRHST